MKRYDRNAAGRASGMRLPGRAALLWGGGISFLAGSLAVGVTGIASSSPQPQPTVVNQGSAGSQPWPVSATGTLGISNFPSGFNINNLPTTQPVSGTVGIDQTHNGVTVNNLPSTQNVSGTVGIDQTHNGVTVNNLPSTQNVSGSVSISGTPTVVNGDKTVEVYGDGGTLDPAGGAMDQFVSNTFLDISPYKTIRLSVQCDASTPNITWAVLFDGGNYQAHGDVSSGGIASQTFEIPGTTAQVFVQNKDSVSHDCFVELLGRAN